MYNNYNIYFKTNYQKEERLSFGSFFFFRVNYFLYNEKNLKEGIKMTKKYRKSKTFKNKVYALLLLSLGVISAWVFKDLTFLVFVLIFFVLPLSISKENYII